MRLVRDIVSQSLARRAELGIRVRQPLQRLKIKSGKLKAAADSAELLDLIKGETNIKEIVFDNKIKEKIEIDAEITPALKEEGDIREIIRHIQRLRQRAGLTPKEEIVIYFSGEPFSAGFLERNKNSVLKATKAKGLEERADKEGNFLAEKEIKAGKGKIWLAIKKG